MSLKALLGAAFLMGVLMLPVAGQAESIKLATGNGYHPYSDEALPGGGLTTSIIARAFAQAGLEADIAFLPWKRGLLATKAGQFLGTFPYVRTPEREVDFLFSDPVVFIEEKIFVQNDSTLTYEKMEDLHNLDFCMAAGYAISKPLVPLEEASLLRRFTPQDIENCFKMVFFGRVDFVSMNELSGWSTAQRALEPAQLAQIRTLDKPLVRDALHLMVPKGDEEGKALLKRFNEALGILRQQGILDGIVEEYKQRILSGS